VAWWLNSFQTATDNFYLKHKYWGKFFQRRKPQKAGLGWQPQQVSDRGTNERKAICKFSFAYYSFIGSRFWPAAFLFLLLIIQDTGLLPADCNLFTSVIQKTGKWQPSRQKNFPVHSKHHRPAYSAKNGRKKSSKSFSRLTASYAAVRRRAIQF